MKSDIVMVHLMNGEDIIGKQVSLTTDTIKLRKPARMVMMPGQNPHQPTVGLIPWLQFADEEEVTLNRDHILFMVTPIKQFITNYQQMFSEIITPQSSLVLPS